MNKKLANYVCAQNHLYIRTYIDFHTSFGLPVALSDEHTSFIHNFFFANPVFLGSELGFSEDIKKFCWFSKP